MNKLGDLLTQSQGLANVNLGLLNIHGPRRFDILLLLFNL